MSDLFTLSAYLFIRKMEQNTSWTIKKISYTVENSLEKDEEEIFSGFDSTSRSHIRRAEREGLKCSFNYDVVGFVEFYNAFASNKKIPLTSEQRIIEMGGNLSMSYATLDGKILSAHSYLTDKDTGIVLLFHSASLRFDNTIDANTIGRSNRFLHYKDMIYFKEQGFKVYDFGGFAENTDNVSLAGINRFKLSFGGNKVSCVNYYSIGYVLFQWLAKILKITK